MSKLVISNEASENDPLLENVTDYKKMMGKLIYLTNTRPDISYDVHCLSQFMHSSLSSHLKIAFKILRYLKSCPGLGIHIVRTSGMFLNAYSDADWANKKQNTISKSSTEAEYRALASLTTIKIAANPVFHERTKHLEIDFHFVRENILNGVVKTVKVDSANQIADILTKGLDTIQHYKLVKKLALLEVELGTACALLHFELFSRALHYIVTVPILHRVEAAQVSVVAFGNAKNSVQEHLPRPTEMFHAKIIPALKEKGIRRVISRKDQPHGDITGGMGVYTSIEAQCEIDINHMVGRQVCDPTLFYIFLQPCHDSTKIISCMVLLDGNEKERMYPVPRKTSVGLFGKLQRVMHHDKEKD
ncbi:hypothetical protein Tco_1139867 [Tanacetum coccineum]